MALQHTEACIWAKRKQTRLCNLKKGMEGIGDRKWVNASDDILWKIPQMSNLPWILKASILHSLV